MTATMIMSANEHNQQHLKRLHVFAHVAACVGVCVCNSVVSAPIPTRTVGAATQDYLHY